MLIPAFLILLAVFLTVIVYHGNGSLTDSYVNIQKDLFFSINRYLSQFSTLQYNLTQLGDVLIIFPLLTIFLIKAPKFWEALLSSALLSLVISAGLKRIFAVPRPAGIFDNETFIIIGKTISGNTSLPSGHTIVTFFVITLLWYAFMPKKFKIIWTFILFLAGYIIAFSRVGVGAHFPLDVVVGSGIGYIIAMLGIKISNAKPIFGWLKNKNLYPIYMIVLAVWSFCIIKKILDVQLIIFYISFLSLVITFYLIARSYVKKPA